MYKEKWEVKAEIFMAAEKMGNTVVIYEFTHRVIGIVLGEGQLEGDLPRQFR